MSEGGSEREQSSATNTPVPIAEVIRKQERLGRRYVAYALLFALASIPLAVIRIPLLIVAAFVAALAFVVLRGASVGRKLLEGGDVRGDAAFEDRARELRALLGRRLSALSRMSTAHTLAELHWQRGEVAATDDVLSANLSAKSLEDRGTFGEFWGEAHALRLLAKAARGEQHVELELAALERVQTPMGSGWARVAAAKAIVALRRGDRAAAIDALREIERVTDDAKPLDRALCRALRAFALTGAPVDLYRSPHPSTRGSVVRAWVERVFPAAADFVDEAPVATESERSWLADPKEPKQALPVKRRHVNFAWLGWIIGVWIYTAVATLTVLSRAWYEPWSSVVQFGWVPIALGFALALVRERRARAELACIRAARWQNVLGDTNVAAHDLRVISESKFPFPASKALIDLASHEALRGEFAEASVLLERGVERGVSLPGEGRGALHFVEGLVLRALLFAWQGREAQAESALATALAYVPIEPFASSMKYEVRFWTALALARREQAIEIARGCDVHTITSGRTDLARDALLSLGDPSAGARVLERIDAWPSVKTFFTKVCPWLLDELRQQPVTHVRVDATPDRLPESQRAESRSADDASGGAHGRGGSTP